METIHGDKAIVRYHIVYITGNNCNDEGATTVVCFGNDANTNAPKKLSLEMPKPADINGSLDRLHNAG